MVSDSLFDLRDSPLEPIDRFLLLLDSIANLEVGQSGRARAARRCGRWLRDFVGVGRFGDPRLDRCDTPVAVLFGEFLLVAFPPRQLRQFLTQVRNLVLLPLDPVADESLLGLLSPLTLGQRHSRSGGGAQRAARFRPINAAAVSGQPADDRADYAAGRGLGGGVDRRRHPARGAGDSLAILNANGFAGDLDGCAGFVLPLAHIDDRVRLPRIFIPRQLAQPLGY